jgi:predicted RNA methylase
MGIHRNEAATAGEVGHFPYDLSATFSAALTMENDSSICAKIDKLRRIDGTITEGDLKKVFNEARIELDEWAQGDVDFGLLAINFNDEREPEPIKDAVLESLKTADISGKTLQLTTQLERNDYLKVDKIIEALGGKWNKKASAHVFPMEDAEEKISNFILTGKLDKPEKFGFFPTPAPLAKRLIEMSGLPKDLRDIRILESSAGIGNLAEPCAQIVGLNNVMCFELQERNCKVLREKGFQVRQCDFLSEHPLPVYDYTIINPPFERQQDIDHVIHSYKFLKPGGTLAAIMSGSVSFRTNKKSVEFREFLSSLGAELVENEPDAFKSSGTMVRTNMVKFIKPLLEKKTIHGGSHQIQFETQNQNMSPNQEHTVQTSFGV